MICKCVPDNETCRCRAPKSKCVRIKENICYPLAKHPPIQYFGIHTISVPIYKQYLQPILTLYWPFHEESLHSDVECQDER